MEFDTRLIREITSNRSAIAEFKQNIDNIQQIGNELKAIVDRSKKLLETSKDALNRISLM